MQQNEFEKQKLGLQSYYNGLDKKDKARLIGFLMWKCGISFNSAWNRLSGKTDFSDIELQVIYPLIMEDTWRQ